MSSLPTAEWTLLASDLSLAPTWKGACWMTSDVDLSRCCLSMGFSSSPYFVQTTNESIMSRSLEPTGSRIMNDRASPATFAAGNRQEGATGSNQYVFVDTLGVRRLQDLGGRETDSCLRFLRQTRSKNP